YETPAAADGQSHGQAGGESESPPGKDGIRMELNTGPDYRNLLGRIWCDSVALIELIVCRRVPSMKTAFPDMPRLSPRHLKYMRKFAEAWPDRAIMQRPVA